LSNKIPVDLETLPIMPKGGIKSNGNDDNKKSYDYAIEFRHPSWGT